MADGKITIEFEGKLGKLKKDTAEAKKILDALKTAQKQNDKAMADSSKRLASYQKKTLENQKAIYDKQRAITQLEASMRSTELSKGRKEGAIAKKKEAIRAKEADVSYYGEKHKEYVNKALTAKKPEDVEKNERLAQRQVELADRARASIASAEKELKLYEKELESINQKEKEQNRELEKRKHDLAEIESKMQINLTSALQEKQFNDELVAKSATLNSLIKEKEKLVTSLAEKQKTAVTEEKKVTSESKKGNSHRKRSNTLLKSMIKLLKGASKGFRLLGKLALKPFNKFPNILKKVNKGISFFGKRLRNAAIQGLLLRPVREAFYSIYEVISNAIKQNDAFKKSFANLSGTLYTALVPVFERVLPIIVKVMDTLAKIITYVSAFINAMLGLKNATAEEGKALAESAKSEEEKRKEKEKSFAGWDTIQQLQKPDTGTETKTEPTFEQDFSPAIEKFEELRKVVESGDWENIGETIAGYLNEIIYKMQDWMDTKYIPFMTSFGSNLAKFFNGLLDGVDFTAIATLISTGLNGIIWAIQNFFLEFDSIKFGSKIADFFNGLFVGIDWATLGQDVGLFFNFIIDTIIGFNQNFDAVTAGIKIADFFTHIFDTIDWEGLSIALSDSLNNLITVTSTALANFDPEKLGSNVATFFNGLFDRVDWNGLSTTLSQLLNGLVKTTTTFLDKFDSDKLGGNVAVFFNGMFDKVDWKGIGKLLAKSLNEIFELVAGFFKKFDGKKFGKSMGEAFSGMIKNIDFGKVGEALGEFVKDAIDALTGFIEEVDWVDTGATFVKGFSDMIDKFDLTGVLESLSEFVGAVIGGLLGFLLGGLSQIAADITKNVTEWWEEFKKKCTENGSFSAQGFLDGVVDTFKDIGKWIKEHIFDPFFKGFKEAFGINSPSKEMKPLGGFVIDGVLNGITEGLKGIGEWVKTNIFKPIWDGLMSAFGIDTGDSEKMKEIGTAIAGGLSSGIESAVGKIKGVINGIIDIVEKAMNWIIDNLNKIHVDAPDWVEETFGIEGFGFDLKHISIPRLALAQGGVVNPGHKFSAILGDNRTEKEVVSPLSTMKQALLEALQESGMGRGGDITLQVDGATFARITTPYLKKETNRIGVSAIGGVR